LLYRLTGSAVALGINAALQFLPMLLFGAWAGALSDRYNRQRTTVITQTLLASQAIVLGVCDIAGVINMPIVFVLTGFLGIVGAIDNPARRGLVTELVPEHDMSNAMSLNTAVMTGSRIFGPALAAALVGPLGTGWLFVINGVSYAAMLYGVAGLRKSEMFSPPLRPAGGTPVRDGLRFGTPIFGSVTISDYRGHSTPYSAQPAPSLAVRGTGLSASTHDSQVRTTDSLAERAKCPLGPKGSSLQNLHPLAKHPHPPAERGRKTRPAAPKERRI
jgi:MFS family permease